MHIDSTEVPELRAWEGAVGPSYIKDGLAKEGRNGGLPPRRVPARHRVHTWAAAQVEALGLGQQTLGSC
jgi:hypothetical protein